MLVDDGDTIRIDDIELTAIHLIGHTPGSIALLYVDIAGGAREASPRHDPKPAAGPLRGASRPRTTYSATLASVYDSLPEEIQADLPLTRIWTIAGDGE